MEDGSTNISTRIGFCVDDYIEGGDKAIKDFIKENQALKKKRKESIQYLKTFMVENRMKLIKWINLTNVREKENKTINDYIEIAIGWDVEDIDSLVKLAKKEKFREFIYLLTTY